ncbi:hypothetical protein F511_33941 [Dorcoceras hygrometricum]|uniref:Uncharacterized protein n=1 Tax=Dorcoceras hygrometricum TaxID=472368 RepID=A0A2Z7BN29_9LAMI|nr:hypothetical protein F511_33941 [Dorcoceras hygrometricum]
MHQNFESGTPTTAIDLQVLEMLSDAHHIALKQLMEQMRQHKLKWIRPSSSNLFEGAIVQCGAIFARSNTTIRSNYWIRHLILFGGSWTVVQGFDRWFHLFDRLLPVGTYNLCTAIVAVGPILDRSTVPRRIVNTVQRRIQAESFGDFFVQHTDQNLSSTSSSEIVGLRISDPSKSDENRSDPKITELTEATYQILSVKTQIRKDSIRVFQKQRVRSEQGAWLRPISRGNRHFMIGGGRLRQSGPRSEGRLLRQPALKRLTRSARTETPRKVGRNKFRRGAATRRRKGGGGGDIREGRHGGQSLGARVRVCCNQVF